MSGERCKHTWPQIGGGWHLCAMPAGHGGAHIDNRIDQSPAIALQAVPEPRSTPGPSTGTPEPSQAASEAHWRHEIVVGALDNLAHDCASGAFASYGAGAATLAADFRSGVLRLAASEAHSGEVARLREALEQVRALADEWWGRATEATSERPSWRRCSRELREALASVDAPAPDEADEDTMQIDVARAIWETSRADEGTISATGANHVAGAVLAVLREKGALR